MSAVQLARHAMFTPSQRKGLQEGLPALPAGSGLHVPVEQLPHAPQALLQQMPEVHWPLWHCRLAAQDTPFGCGEAHWSFWPAGICWQPALQNCLTPAAPPAALQE
jgi:hypothetical protein